MSVSDPILDDCLFFEKELKCDEEEVAELEILQKI
jgi:hypothetical protein